MEQNTWKTTMQVLTALSDLNKLNTG